MADENEILDQGFTIAFELSIEYENDPLLGELFQQALMLLRTETRYFQKKSRGGK